MHADRMVQRMQEDVTKQSKVANLQVPAGRRFVPITQDPDCSQGAGCMPACPHLRALRHGSTSSSRRLVREASWRV